MKKDVLLRPVWDAVTVLEQAYITDENYKGHALYIENPDISGELLVLSASSCNRDDESAEWAADTLMSRSLRRSGSAAGIAFDRGVSEIVPSQMRADQQCAHYMSQGKTPFLLQMAYEGQVHFDRALLERSEFIKLRNCVEDVMDRLSGLNAQDMLQINPPALHDKLIVRLDITGYSKMLEKNEDQTDALEREFQEFVTTYFNKFNPHPVIRREGDAAVLMFDMADKGCIERSIDCVREFTKTRPGLFIKISVDNGIVKPYRIWSSLQEVPEIEHQGRPLTGAKRVEDGAPRNGSVLGISFGALDVCGVKGLQGADGAPVYIGVKPSAQSFRDLVH